MKFVIPSLIMKLKQHYHSSKSTIFKFTKCYRPIYEIRCEYQGKLIMIPGQ